MLVAVGTSLLDAFTAAAAGALTGSRLGARLSSARLTQLVAALIVAVARFTASNGRSA